MENKEQEIVITQNKQLPAATTESNPASIMGIIAKLSMHPNVDIDKIERLMNLYTKECEREEAKIAKENADEAERLFYIDFIAMKPSLPLIVRTKDNTHTKSKYAPLEDINKEIDPVLKEFGFATTSRVLEQSEADITMEVAVVHRAGHKLAMTLTMPIDDKGPGGTKNKTTGQGIASTMTSTKRIGFCALLNISTGDDKDGNREEDTIDTEQAAVLDGLITDTKSDKKAFLSYFKVDDVRKIKNADHQKALDMLNKKTRKAAV